jgi:hypothetical protein
MTCTNCGAAVAENRRFCGKCGTDLAPEASNDSAPASPYETPAAPSAWGTGGAIAPSPPAPTSAPPTAPADPFAPPNLDPGAYAGYPPPPGYGPPPAGYGAPGQYPPPGYGYGYAGPHTNGLAVAALVLGLVGWLACGIGSVVAIVLGFIARGQIKGSWGRETGSGMATAGIVLGFIGLAGMMALFIASLFSNSS